jgi:hypothetical protein
MFAILNKILSGPSAKATKAATGFRPALEALESRDLISVAGYSAVGQKDFYIDSSSTLKERDQFGNVHALAGSASQVSVLQGDLQVQYPSARADVLMLNGDLQQWDDAAGWKLIASGVKQVSAGWDGNSAVLSSNGNLSLYNTNTNAWTPVATNIASASLGLDLVGQPMIDMVFTSGYGAEWRAGGGLESLGLGVKQVSAGVGGHSAILSISGDLSDHCDAPYMNFNGNYSGPGTSTFLARQVASVSCGTDLQGGNMLDLVHTDGSACEHSASSGIWKSLGSSVVEADAGRGGVTDVCYSDGSIARYNDNAGSGAADTLTYLIKANRYFLG